MDPQLSPIRRHIHCRAREECHSIWNGNRTKSADAQPVRLRRGEPFSHMTALLPGAFVLILWLGWWSGPGGRREALLKAAVAAGVAVFAITELLSLFHLLNPTALAAAWLATCVGAWVAVRGAIQFPAREQWRSGRIELILACGFAMLLGMCAFVAFMGTERIVDVLVYHLPRIRYWLQQGGVEYFATAKLMQLFMPPWTEYAGLHWMALTGAERGTGLVQVLAMGGSAMAASLLARRLGLGMRLQWLAAALALSIPQGALQAFDLKNDYVCAFWVISAVYLLLRATDSGARRDILWAGAAMGLALLTKATALLFLAPFGLWFAARRKVVDIAWVLLPAMLLNGAMWTRNWRVFGSPLGCDTGNCTAEYPYRNASMAPGAVASNVARNLALHFQTSNDTQNERLEGLFRAFFAYFDADLDDPRTTWQGTAFAMRAQPAHPDFQGNPWHLLLALAAAGALLISLRRKGLTTAHGLALGVLAGALLFCVVLRWQPWHTRLHLPLFVLAAPAIAYTWQNREKGLSVVAVLLLTQAGWLVAKEQAAPAVRRSFTLIEPLPRVGTWAAPVILRETPCRKVLLEVHTHIWLEGEFLRMLGTGLGGAEVRYVNAPPGLREGSCALLCVQCGDDEGRLARFREWGWAERVRGQDRLFLKPPAAATPGAERRREYMLGESESPPWVAGVTGFAEAEGWGRWTDGSVAEVRFTHPWPAGTKIALEGYAFADNAGRAVPIVAGEARSSVVFGEKSAVRWVELETTQDFASVRIHIPSPARPSELWPGAGADTRALGLALTRLILELPPR